MPSYTPDEALALLKETVAKASPEHCTGEALGFCHPTCESCYAREDLEEVGLIFQVLVAELYEQLRRARTCKGCSLCSGAAEQISDTLRTTEDALVAWATEVGMRQ